MASEQMDISAQARIQSKIEKSIPDAGQRRAALELLGYAIENADSERSDAWSLEESGHGLKLLAGRLLVCHVTRKNLKLSVLGPLKSEIYAALDADADDSEVWKAIPEGLFLTFPVDKAGAALDLLKVEIDKFVDEAMSRVRRTVCARPSPSGSDDARDATTARRCETSYVTATAAAWRGACCSA